MTAFIYTTVGLAAFAFVVVGITALLERNKRYLDAMIADGLAQTAADFGEPTRADVEADWIFDDQPLYGPAAMWPTDTPVYDETVAVIAKRAALDIDTDWAAMNGGAS